MTFKKDKNKKKIGLVWADPYNGNMGVAALAYSSIVLIDSIAEKNRTNIELTLIGSKGPVHDELIINGKKIEIYNIFGHNYFSLKYFLRLILSPQKFNLLKIINQDIVFDISGGDSFSDIYGSARFKAMLNSKRLYNLFKRKQVLLPQTIGPFKNKQYEKFAFDQMAKMDFVFSRDKQSYDYTKQFLKEQKIYESIDVAFLLPYKKTEFSNGKINIGINISGLLWNGGYDRNNQFNLKGDYKDLIMRIIEFFLEDDLVQVHLVPHVITKRDDHVESDYGVSMNINKMYKNVIIAPKFKDPIEAKSYISGLDFFIGARMHSCIGAFSSNVPVYPLAYSRKFNGLFCDTLNYDEIGDCVREDNDAIFHRMVKAYEHRMVLKKEVENINNSLIKPRVDLLKDKISQIIDEK